MSLYADRTALSLNAKSDNFGIDSKNLSFDTFYPFCLIINNHDYKHKTIRVKFFLIINNHKTQLRLKILFPIWDFWIKHICLVTTDFFVSAVA